MPTTGPTSVTAPVEVPDTARAVDWRAVATAAVTAPSVHNSQPWTLRLLADGLEVHVDLSRQLVSLDPDGRDLGLSVGAAVGVAAAVLAAQGHEPVVGLAADPPTGTLRATLRAGRAEAPDQAARELADAVPRRHTQRATLTSPGPSAALVARLRLDAVTAGGWLEPLPADVTARLWERLAELEVAATRDPARLAETGAWVHRDPLRVDGIPTRAVPPPDGGAATGRFGGGGGLLATEVRPPPPALFAVGARTDTPAGWTAAGDARIERTGRNNDHVHAASA